jgi:hypothetical protein
VSHGVHVALPVVLLYFPATHTVQVPPFGPVYPALQALAIHAPLDVLAVDESEPMGQVEHDALPVVFLYFPATHAVQVPPFAPVKPALQMQAVSAVLEFGEVELPGHVEHVADKYLPAVQYSHN